MSSHRFIIIHKILFTGFRVHAISSPIFDFTHIEVNIYAQFHIIGDYLTAVADYRYATSPGHAYPLPSARHRRFSVFQHIFSALFDEISRLLKFAKLLLAHYLMLAYSLRVSKLPPQCRHAISLHKI